ncbi:GNAT family N-acetyltransferase [Thermomonas carbonis]|uniref:GNAT family N-acetyltransferase n=1 Tax=Thermomonas carbonis TaxID=1463158 RepID=A0A7G9SNN7_9GAMM|nr:GNAT family N-acetyltransferase [Thermomonas carbonis]QNN69462.1 GNAT family N-acetyltransferase [Thermomonas carbonis]GHB93281.1 acyl-CoA synthetase [Thermomonas carbonis]
MAARNRMPPWHEKILLANGREVLVRPIRPEDAVPLRAAFVLLEPDEVRQRFLHPMKELGVEQAERLTHPDPRREFALVAAEPLPPGEALVGAVARIAIDDNGRDAEFAILVSHYVNGMGLGRHLMRRLVRWAKGRKVLRIYGEVLESNLPMQALAASLGFQRESSGDPGMIRMVLDLPPPKPKLPPPLPGMGAAAR